MIEVKSLYDIGFEHGYAKAKEEAESKRGKWIKLYHGNYKCSECGEWWGSDYNDEVINDFNYCPSCGAKMDGEENE